MRVVRAMLGVAMVGVLLFAATSAFAAGTSSHPAGGLVRVFATPGNGASGKIVLTGAIGDYGKTLNVNGAGKPDSNGSFVKITLHKGSFVVNSAALNKKLNSLKPTFNKNTCSAALVATSPVTLSDGQGLYKGISGKIMISVSFAIVGPRLANGQCNPSNNAKPLAQYQAIIGSGRVSFS